MSSSRRSLSLPVLAALPLICALGAGGCDRDPRIEEVVVHRDSCLVCHRPLDADGRPAGIEEAHPWLALSCTDCHGGQARICDGTLSAGATGEPECDGSWVYDKKRAHVQPRWEPTFLRNLSSQDLDNADPRYLRFINPGDFRVLGETCGRCHAEAARLVPTSTMAHTSGEVTVARYRAGMQPDALGIFGAADTTPATSTPADACASPRLAQFNPSAPPADLGSITVGQAQDQYMVKSCFRCHLNDFGENRFSGDYRSSGCTACHMTYADDGLSETADPMVSRQTLPHPRRHELTAAPPIEACTHCHYRGGRLGIGFQGYRESGGAGQNPPDPDVLGRPLHGHDARYYLSDEDTTNDWDETPPDVHFEAGMHCVDCHTLEEVHGNGHLYADTQCIVKTECTDCHGTARARATVTPERPNLFERDGKLFLRARVTGQDLEIRQVQDAVTPGHERYSRWAELAMGVDAKGKSHTDDLECYTCHAGWMPACYGCHVRVDFSRSKRYQTTGALAPGHPTGTRRWVVLNDLVLMRNTDGMIAPSMPSERFFLTVLVPDDTPGAPEGAVKTLFESKPRTFVLPDGRRVPGFGQRAFNPHTTRRKSAFAACDRCHSVGDPERPENAVLLDLTWGFGTRRFMQAGCNVGNDDPSCDKERDWIPYALDAVLTRQGDPLVVVGHPEPEVSRPLSLGEIGRMRAVVVEPAEPYRTDIPKDAATNPKWPFAKRFAPGPSPPPPASIIR